MQWVLRAVMLHIRGQKHPIKSNKANQSPGYVISFPRRQKVAAVLLLPFIVISGWLFYNQQNLTQKYSNLLENKHSQNLTVVAPFCARIVVDLPMDRKCG